MLYKTIEISEKGGKVEQEYFSPTQAGKLLGISRQAVIERIKHGTLYAEKVGKRYIIPRNQLPDKEITLEKKKLKQLLLQKQKRT